MLGKRGRHFIVVAIVVGLLELLGTGPVAAGVTHNGVNLNGVNLNGVNLNGVNLNGVNLNGVNLNGVNLNGVNLNGVNLNGTNLTGTIANLPGSSCSHSELAMGAALPATCSKCSKIVSNADPYCKNTYWDSICRNEAYSMCSFDAYDLEGAELTGTKSNGSTVKLRIDDVSPTSDPQVVHYEVSYYRPGYWFRIYDWSTRSYRWIWASAAWLPICAGDNQAIPVAGQWPDCVGPGCGGKASDWGMVFSCSGVGAVAKCVEDHGYKPWVSDDMDRTHEACVRMLRADYCGIGEPHTTDGRTINSYDRWGIETDTRAWSVEARWTTAGATCLSSARYEQLRELSPADDYTCFEKLHMESGSGCAGFPSYVSGVVIISEFP